MDEISKAKAVFAALIAEQIETPEQLKDHNDRLQANSARFEAALLNLLRDHEHGDPDVLARLRRIVTEVHSLRYVIATNELD